MPTEPSDEEVMMDYQAGHEGAFRELFERYKGRILHFCVGLLGNRADAEDVAGEVFLAVVAQRNGYHRGPKLSTWLYTIAHHKCVDRIRRRRWVMPLGGRRQALEDDEEAAWDPPSPQESAVETLARKDVAARVRQAIVRLPVEQREAIMLRQYHDCSYEQISEVLQCSLAKVKVLIFRGKERLRTELVSLVKEDRP
ncbi:MAG: RNA polymerase sigma factor [Candidatus Omnitrophica bacterium]|nr:RNA polymerase sigma factor [Candidatus Omnitrophota bacterium]